MVGRWPNTPQPALIEIAPGIRVNVAQLEDTVNIYPGETQNLDIAIRADDDEECYGWNNEAYFSNPVWRNPDWKLKSGRYLVRVIITSSGQKKDGWFRLENSAGRRDFRLQPYAPKFPH